jgi:hypothetical protein
VEEGGEGGGGGGGGGVGVDGGDSIASSEENISVTAEEKGAMANPAIVNFAGPGPVKPWNARCQHIFRSRYLEAKAETPWASIALDDVPAPAWRQALDKKVFRIKCLLRRKLFGDQ